MAAEKKQDRDTKSLNRDGGREIERDRQRETLRERETEREREGGRERNGKRGEGGKSCFFVMAHIFVKPVGS